MPRNSFARDGSRKHTGTGAAFATGAPWWGLKALADVTITTILGPDMIDHDGTAGQLSSIDLAKGDELFCGQINSITVPSGKAILLYRF